MPERPSDDASVVTKTGYVSSKCAKTGAVIVDFLKY